MIGDAPPFKHGFREEAHKVARRFSDEQLLQIAVEKGITIHSIVSPTREKDRPIYDQVINDLRDFFELLSQQTGGSMIDLSTEEGQAYCGRRPRKQPKFSIAGSQKLPNATLMKWRITRDPRGPKFNSPPTIVLLTFFPKPIG